MPESYPVNWGENDSSWGAQAGGLFKEALMRRQANQLAEAERAKAAEQEQYERGEAEKDRARQKMADEFQAERLKLDIQAAKQKKAEFDLASRSRQQKEALEQGQQFRAQQPDASPTFEASQQAPVAPGQAPMATPDSPEERAAFAQSQPAEVVQPAIPGIEPGDPNVAEQRTINPGLLARAAEAMRAQAMQEEAAKAGAVEGARRTAAEPFAIADDRRAATAAAAAASRAEQARSQGLSDELRADLERLPDSWTDWKASHVTRDSYTPRNNAQANAIAAANSLGKVLPDKKQGAAAITAKAQMSDIRAAQALLQDPEIREYVGAYQGKMTNFLAKGWADPWGGEKNVPDSVRKFRANLNRLAAEERHRIYGAALTAVESKFAEGFLPALDQSGGTIDAALGEFADDIDRGMTAMWGSDPDEPGTPAAAGGVKILSIKPVQ